MAQTRNTDPTQDVCIGPQVYTVTDVPGASFTWTLTGGGTFTPSTTNTITVVWDTPSVNPYTLSVQATNGTCLGNITTLLVTVHDAPVGPSIKTKTPDVLSFCAGLYPNVSATFNAGSGGVGCSDEFRFSTDDGLTWLQYLEGTDISTSGVSQIEIQGRHAGCTAGTGCTGTEWAPMASWTITTAPEVSVTITPDPAQVCAGTSLTFTALPVNGGTPTYKWFVNTIEVPGEVLNTYTYIFANGDQVKCELTSSLTCGVNNPATSNIVTVTVNAIPVTSAINHN